MYKGLVVLEANFKLRDYIAVFMYKIGLYEVIEGGWGMIDEDGRDIGGIFRIYSYYKWVIKFVEWITSVKTIYGIEQAEW